MNNSMMLITSTWGQKKTFKLIPTSLDCPYNECIYDPDAKVLALIGKEKKQQMHMLPKLNDQGDVQRMKIGKRENGKDYAEERKTVETYYEYYVEEPAEVRSFVEMFASNHKNFDYDSYLNAKASEITPVQNSILTGV